MTGPPSIPCPTPAGLEVALTSGGPDPALRAHLDACPSCAEQARQVAANIEFMRRVVGALTPEALATLTLAPINPDAAPGYRLVREIARGGQGAVYEAVQIDTRRRVAVKIVDFGPSGANARRRFEREAELAASLRHPNIVTIYQTLALPDGRHALAMEYVDGRTLDQWAAEIDRAAPATAEGAREAVRAKLRAVSAVCGAVQHAHVNGVIHRDLKPANVIVGADGAPRVVDFGIARRVERSTQITREGSFAGTLAYASPEQVSGQPEHVDTRTDVYSLGLMLYEVLAGRRPYETDGSLTGAIANIVSVRPPPIERTQPGGAPAGAELEAIVAKALAKPREARYQSAAALGRDIENLLAGRAIEARQNSAVYVLRKMAARHRAGVAAAIGLLALLIAFAGAMAWSSRTLARQRNLLADALVSSAIERGRSVGRSGENARAEELIWPELLRLGADPDDPDLLFSSGPLVTQAAWALCELYSRHPSLLHAPLPAGAQPARFEDGGSRLRLIHLDGAQTVLSLPGGAIVESIPGVLPHAGRINVSADLRRAALAAPDGSTILLPLGAPDAKPLTLHVGPDSRVWDVSPDGSRVLTVSPDNVVTLAQPSPFRAVAELRDAPFLNNKPSFSADGRLVIWGVGDRIRAWRADDGAPAGAWPVPADLWSTSLRSAVYCVRIDPGSRWIAAGFHTALQIYDVARTEAPPRTLAPGHRGFVGWVEFSADGSRLLSQGSEQNSKVWDPESGELVMAFDHRRPLRGRPVISDDGRLVAVADEDSRLRVFESTARAWLQPLRGAGNTVHRAEFSPDGSLIAGASSDGLVRLWRRADARLLWEQRIGEGTIESLAFAPDGRSIALAGADGRIVIIDPLAPAEQRTLAHGPAVPTWLAFSPDGSRLAAAGAEAACTLYDAATGEVERRLEGHAGRVIQGAFSPDGARLYTVGADGVCIAWDLRSGAERFRTAPVGARTRAVAVAPGGRLLATGSDDWTIRLWDAATGRLLSAFASPRQQVFGLAFHPSGNVLFSCGRDPVVQAWDVRTGRELALLEGHADLVLSVAVSPDGRSLVTASADRTVGLWDLDHYRRRLEANAPAWRVEPNAPR